jgi:dolichyl-phosphate-mannose-protein mannosyltransferase
MLAASRRPLAGRGVGGASYDPGMASMVIGSGQGDVVLAPPLGERRPGVPLSEDPLYSWACAGFVTLVALVLRLADLGFPSGKIFDEIYYATDAHNLLLRGVEWDDKQNGPAFVAHPPLGKWLIALGEHLFGYNSFGWRIVPALAGAATVLVLVRVGQRLFGSTLLGCAAGLLLAVDGLHFVMSRVALLDVFLTLFVLIAFACLLIERDARRARLLAGVDAAAGWRAWPWWWAGAGVFLGLGLGVKWSALWFIPAFVFLTLAWEVGARRVAGSRAPYRESVRSGGLGLAVIFGFAGLAYLATWTGWFLSDDGWGRHWAEQTGNTVPFVPDALVNLWHYERAVLHFHDGLDTPHPYQSTPWSWLTLGRPVAFYAQSPTGCGADKCEREIVALGTPPLWWSFYPAMLMAAWRWLARRDWRGGALLLCILSGWVPWMFYPQRTMFLFYILPALPFLVLAVTYGLGLALGPASAPRERRLIGATIVGLYLTVILVTFVYFYPVYTGELLTWQHWYDRMWFDSWW